MKKRWLVIVLLGAVICMCSPSVPFVFEDEHGLTPNDYVDVFIGTRSPGHTFPGPMRPFGMVQLSPDTRNDHTSWPACAGYDYDDTSIIGFTHTHLSGTGVPDLGDILFMPCTGGIQFEAGAPDNPDSGYRSRYSHDQESARPGFYQVTLSDDNIRVELTATRRVGFHRYTFPQKGQGHIIVDLRHRDPVRESSLEMVSPREITGFRRSKAWAGDQRIYFCARFSHPIQRYEGKENGVWKENEATLQGKAVVAALHFDVRPDEPLLVKVGISAVSAENARLNLEAECSHWDFDRVREDAADAWNRSLSRIAVTGGAKKEKRIFYTALYHSLLTPNLFSDVNGEYRGMDSQVHRAKGFDNYTVFSLWDTFRGLHPLLTILEPKRTRDMMISLQKKYEEFGELPMWELHSNDTRCMIGYHAVSMIADAYLKGITDVDANALLDAMVASATVEKRGIGPYSELGYVPTNKSSQSVSKTLEYAYDDWCIAQMAQAVGREEVYHIFSRRARFFENVFDPSTNFMRPRRSDGAWVEDFDPQAVSRTYNFNFTEGNSYQYSLFVPHDIATLVRRVGGDDAFNAWLDHLFATDMEEDLSHGSDVSGLLGQYSHGNEPSHHMAYLYNYAGSPWKSQAMVRRIMHEFYDDTPEGLCGNDDCGQMSAWYVLGALGFYSVCPGMPQYVMGSPLFQRADIRLDNGKMFTVSAENNASNNVYIQSAEFNGATYPHTFIHHEDIMRGGRLTLVMDHFPNKTRAIEPVHRPASDTKAVVAIPRQRSDHREFIDSKTVELTCDTPGAEIFYSLDGSQPTRQSVKYEGPLTIYESTVLKMRAFKEGLLSSYPVTLSFVKMRSVGEQILNGLKPGLAYRYYEGIYRSVYDFRTDAPADSGTVDAFHLSPLRRNEWVGLAFKGYIRIPRSGLYTFEVSANDGAQLKINGMELFESDGRKAFNFTQKNRIYLPAGYHRIELDYFQCSDRIHLKTYWSGPGFARIEIPAHALSH